MNVLRFFSQRPPWRELKFDKDHNCYIISQYSKDKWLVSVADAEKKIIPHIKTNGQLLPLSWDKRSNGFIVPRKERHVYNALDEAITGRAGKLVLCDQEGKELSPYLYIFTETISEEDYAAILDRLGQLAIAHESGVLAPVTVLREAVTQQEKVHNFKGDAFENLARVVEENWENIKNNPAKEIKLDAKIVDMTNLQTAHSVRVISHAVQKPHQRRQQVLERQETYDSEENRFLVHVLQDILLPKAKPLAEYFRDQATKIKVIQRKPDAYRHGQSYLRLWQERRAAIEQESKRLEDRATAIEKIVSNAKGHLNEPFLTGIRGSSASSLRPSAKIADSKEYGPIYKAYQEYLSNTKPAQQKSLTWALEERSIRRSSKLYEIWVFFEIYSRLVHEFGFRPEGDSPMQLVEVMDGEITLREGSEYRLSFTPTNSRMPLCNAILAYSPRRSTPACTIAKRCFDRLICPSLPCYRKIQNGDWAHLQPDITLIFQGGGLIKKIALDVKYRNYLNQEYVFAEDRELYEVNTVFEADLLGTAKMKYHNGLGYDAAFVLHSDSRPEYTFFGGVPFHTMPLREKNLGVKEWWPGHKVGAVGITPSHSKNLDDLLRCFLMYHMKLVSVCWNPSCHSVLSIENGGMKKQPGYQGDYYQCPHCGEFWVGQVCSGPLHHHLVKMGKDSFHKVSAQNEWNCVCPVCGDQFKGNPATLVRSG
jgi:hypothetical protein